MAPTDIEPPPLNLEWLRQLHGISITENVHGPSSAMVHWEPGDITRYLASVIPMRHGLGRLLGCPGPYAWQLTIWSPGHVGAAIFPWDMGLIAPPYLADKLSTTGYTAQVMAVIANALIPGTAADYAPTVLQKLDAIRGGTTRGFRALNAPVA